MRESEFLEQLLQALLPVGGVAAVEFEDGEDVVLNAEFPEH